MLKGQINIKLLILRRPGGQNGNPGSICYYDDVNNDDDADDDDDDDDNWTKWQFCAFKFFCR